MAVKTCLLLSAAQLPGAGLSSTRHPIHGPQPAGRPCNKVGAPQLVQLNQMTAQAAGSKPCVSDFRRSVAYVWPDMAPVKQYYPGRNFTTCAELCPVLDRYDEWAKSVNYTGFTFGKGWTAMDNGNGPTGIVPTDDMFMSLKVNKVFGLCLVNMLNPDNITTNIYQGTEATVTLLIDVPGYGPNGTVFQGCIIVDKSGSARMAVNLEIGTVCGCQRMCKPRVKGCTQKTFWGGKSCGSCKLESLCSAVPLCRTAEGTFGLKEAGCGCRVKKWGAFWAGWYNRDNRKCYSNVLIPQNVTSLPRPTDYMRQPSCPKVCPKV